MNENLNLVEILKNVPTGTPLYSTVHGEVEFFCLEPRDEFPVCVNTSDGCRHFTKDGLFKISSGECILFPSKDQRDWSKFKVAPKKVEVVLRPFDRVLARRRNEANGSDGLWFTDIYGYKFDDDIYLCVGRVYDECIPYNDDTAHLLGTTDPCPIDYEIKRPEK